MDPRVEKRQRRPIKIQAFRCGIEGSLRVSPGLRTLDDLNVVARNFLTVYEPQLESPDWPVADGPLSINKETILFLTEQDGTDKIWGRRIEPGRFTRSAIRLWVGNFVIQGFLHVPRGGDPMRRLNQDSHPFIALTSTSVVGPNSDSVSSFLAVNRMHISAAQPMSTDLSATAAIEEPGAIEC
jgi:hypothetical protein